MVESAPYTRRYLLCGRIFSYAHQLHAVLSRTPRTVLEVGVGPGMVTASLRAVGVSVTTLDTDAGLQPDLVGSVTSIPAPDSSFDVTICCQVLEHLPWDDFGPSLRELRRVTRQAAVISLPDVSRHLRILVRAPLLGERCWSWSVGRRQQFPRARYHSVGHFWEIGFREYPRRRILAVMRDAGWQVERTWRVPELSWHRFFLLAHSGLGACGSPT